MEVLPGKPHENTTRMLDHVRAAKNDSVDLIVFPEMAVPGYLIGDEWERETFLRECEQCCSELRLASRGIIVIFGCVGLDWSRRNEDGRVRKYNALFIAEDSVFLSPGGCPSNFVIKTLLPNYREFDDSRHFFDLRKLAMEEDKALEELTSPVKTKHLSLGCLLCEDAWNMDYSVSPIDLLARSGTDIFINISSSPFTLNKSHKRTRVFSEQASKVNRPFVYVNNVGIQNNGKTVFTFDGSSCIYDCHGHRATCGAPFKESCLTVDVPSSESPRFGEPVKLEKDGIAEIYGAIHYGTRKFMELCEVNRITIGVSGGIDSSVAAAVYSRIVSPERLLLVNMPGQFTSARTRGLARTLADNLGCCYADIPIQESVKLTRGQIDNITVRNADGSLEQTLRFNDLMLENIQSRDRASRILAAISAAFGGVFSCNANKSEATVGYTTLYGDLTGYLANLADLWKTEIYELAHYLNERVFDAPIIPEGSIDVTPSAELSAAQNVDEGKGDPLIYPYHDLMFKSWVEWWNRTTPEEILEWYVDGNLEQKLGYKGLISGLFKDDASFIADLEQWWERYDGIGLAKRVQSPPILAIKQRSFGFDYRESQMGARYTVKYRKLKEKLLRTKRRQK